MTYERKVEIPPMMTKPAATVTTAACISRNVRIEIGLSPCERVGTVSSSR